MILKLKDGDVVIELFPDVAPKHVERIKKLANDGLYDNVVFHRVIDGFMAQTGDVRFGNSSNNDFDLNNKNSNFLVKELKKIIIIVFDDLYTNNTIPNPKEINLDFIMSKYFKSGRWTNWRLIK